MVEVQLKGVYGSSLTVDDEGVTFHAKSLVAKGALGTGERRLPFSEITDRSFKPANAATNGHIEVVTANGKSIFHFMTGKAARAATEAFELIVELTPDAGVEIAGRGLTPKSSEDVTPSERDLARAAKAEASSPEKAAAKQVAKAETAAAKQVAKAETAVAKQVAKAETAAAKQVAKAETAEVKQEARDAKAQAKRDRAAEILAKYGTVAAKAVFGGSTVAIYDKGFIRASLFVSNSTPFEELRSISYSRTVQDKSVGGRAGAAMMTGGLSLLASNEKRDTFLSFATNKGVRTLKATGRASESAGLSLEAAGKGVLDVLRAQPSATRAPAAHSTLAPAQPAAAPDPTEQVVKLAQLHAQGILSDDEFAKAKAKALGI